MRNGEEGTVECMMQVLVRRLYKASFVSGTHFFYCFYGHFTKVENEVIVETGWIS